MWNVTGQFGSTISNITVWKRVLVGGTGEPQLMPTAEEYAHHIIYRTLNVMGLAYAKDISWWARRVKGNSVKQELSNLVEVGSVKQVQVEGLKDPLYMLLGIQNLPEVSNEVFMLSPFDILNVFRYRLRDFFNFDYQLECFVPAPKRQYGYFSLPVLAGDTFIARMDAKADRKNKVLIIHNLHLNLLSCGQIRSSGLWMH